MRSADYQQVEDMHVPERNVCDGKKQSLTQDSKQHII